MNTTTEKAPTPASRGRRDRRFVTSLDVISRQRYHFVATTAIPLVLCVVWFSQYPTIQTIDVVVWGVMWTLTGGLGVSLGYHRYFTHGAFAAHPLLQNAMAVAGSMAGQGPVTYWVTVHRCHHQHSDETLDPHSPHPSSTGQSPWNRITSFFHGHMGWVLKHDVPSPFFFSRDLLKNSLVRFYDRTYRHWVFLGIILPGVFMLPFVPSIHGFLRGCVFGGFLRMVVGNQIIWSINSICHSTGSYHFNTKDRSTNNWLLALPAFGESWHNNHHAFPWSARFGLQWWQIDIGWLLIRCVAQLGLASNLKQPNIEQIESRAWCSMVSPQTTNVNEK